ncbi:hypothetical protein L210DRAFT_2347956 [Boletus edulis BED1]|uniref:NADH dehydrogenase subunit 4 n=1 Tax=Boletus edulis BED1 TaxID=1328754 RepID=A0AAD4G5Y1_BOLED|nr:hypothetical protein L210DRAFT_2347956 [Boletus edulis BED1]
MFLLPLLVLIPLCRSHYYFTDRTTACGHSILLLHCLFPLLFVCTFLPGVHSGTGYGFLLRCTPALLQAMSFVVKLILFFFSVSIVKTWTIHFHTCSM